MSNIVLKVEHRRAIAKHSEALYPQACRGLLLGHRSGMSKQVVELIFIDDESEAESESESQDYPYHIPHSEILEGEETARAKDLEIIGSFHSHIDRPARPSIHDREHVDQSFSYVIVGVRQGRAHELATWRLSDDGAAFLQEDIRSA